MNEIGIMQGRLSPPPGDRLQAFPWDSWEEEFKRAQDCGIDAIEWLFEADHYERNPIWTETGVEKICNLIAASGVKVRSVCADYFMPNPFFRVTDAERKHTIEVLNRLILQASRIGVTVILLPILEVSEVRTKIEKVQLLNGLREPLDLAASHGIRLGLETELLVQEYRDLIEQANHSALGAYYDTGNATARGYSTATDIRALRHSLCGVHIKDRKHLGRSVPLGQGDTDFSSLFAALAEIRYTGPLVMQTAFGDDFTASAKAHLEFVKKHLGTAVATMGSRSANSSVGNPRI